MAMALGGAKHNAPRVKSCFHSMLPVQRCCKALVKPEPPASLARGVPEQEGWSHRDEAPRRRRRRWRRQSHRSMPVFNLLPLCLV